MLISEISVAREMELGLLDGGGDEEHSGVGFVEILEIFAREHAIFFGIESLERGYSLGKS